MSFKIALVQFEPQRKNVKANINNIQTLLKGIKSDLIVLPELSNSGYLYDSPESLRQFTEPGDASGLFLSAMICQAKAAGGVIITGYAEKNNGVLFNSASAISPGGVIANYRKTHLFDKELNLFEPGDSGFIVFDWMEVKIGMMICFDWIFPESARSLALAGAQIIAHPANLVMPYCQDAMVTRSIENKVFTITSNRIGQERLGKAKLSFTGGSQITSPSGKILYRGPVNKATVHVVSVDPDDAVIKSISQQNDLINDRRPNLYRLT